MLPLLVNQRIWKTWLMVVPEKEEEKSFAAFFLCSDSNWQWLIWDLRGIRQINYFPSLCKDEEYMKDTQFNFDPRINVIYALCQIKHPPPKKNYLLQIRIFWIKWNTSYERGVCHIKNTCFEYFEDWVVINITLFIGCDLLKYLSLVLITHLKLWNRNDFEFMKTLCISSKRHSFCSQYLEQQIWLMSKQLRCELQRPLW